ncbi:hypothetical protein JH26_22975 [Microvirga sp. BSC39]|nr:hypothetical protein JH26_22975 [Microvirga sp. BSC39]
MGLISSEKAPREAPKQGSNLVSVREFACDVLTGTGQNLNASTIRKLNCPKPHDLQPRIDSLLRRSIACDPSPSLDPIAWGTRLGNRQSWLTTPLGCPLFPLLGTRDAARLLG